MVVSVVVVMVVAMVMIVSVVVVMSMIMAMPCMIMASCLAACRPGTSPVSLHYYDIWLNCRNGLLDLGQHSIRILRRKTKLFRSIGHRHI
jgi:hypothetical protein